MVKTDILIFDYKDVNSTLTTFKTNLGQMSAFKNEGDTLIDDLKSHTNRLISVETKQTISKGDGKTYVNIENFMVQLLNKRLKSQKVLKLYHLRS